MEPRECVSIPTTALVFFFVLTFSLTWVLIGTYVIAPNWASSTFGKISGSHPFFFLATWAPAISALVLVGYFEGASGCKSFLKRLLLWRCAVGWVALVLFVIPIIYIAGSLLKGGTILAPVPPEGVGAVVSALLMMLFLGPVEELGWRGFAQPILQRHIAPIWAGVCIGAIWGVWHLPAFFLSGTVFGSWNFLPFFVGNIVLAVLVTPLLNQTRGSILWPMLFHWQLINPFWPDARPYDTWILLAVLAVVIWFNRGIMFTRKDAVTDVLLHGDASSL